MNKAHDEIRAYNREAWDRQVFGGKNEWTLPVSPEVVAAARMGEWEIVLTPQRAVPREWFGATFPDCDVLCLASGGGQQGPVLAAAGARITVLDNSPAQLAGDELVARRDGLSIRTVEGDAADLQVFPAASFDLIVHPCSNVFMPDIAPVWREAFRVLRPGGALLSGICNPAMFIFDIGREEQGELVVRHSLPYSDLTHLSEEERSRLLKDEPLQFSHSLEEQIGGQLDAGFLLAGFFEDNWPASANQPLSRYMPCFFATRAVKPLSD